MTDTPNPCHPAEQQARQALELINLTLQREPFGLGAQLFAHPDEIEVESTEQEI